MFSKIITQEDWNEVLYNGIENTSFWSSLYFIFLMTFGNYILTNLLIAIIVDGFVEVIFFSTINILKLMINFKKKL